VKKEKESERGGGKKKGEKGREGGRKMRIVTSEP